ncbi:MAG: YdcF family protein [Ignavibacteria bacterium]|nr:YdcF family protein [Ignavibacteria bacterium]
MKKKILNIKSISLFLMVCNLLLIYFFKYSHNSILPLEFSIYNIGNLYNFISFLILFSGAIIMYYKAKENVLNRTILIMGTFLIIFMIGAILFNKDIFDWMKSYILGYSAKKIIVASFLSANGLLQIYMIIVVYSKILGSSNFVFVKGIYISVFVFIIMLSLSFIYIASYKTQKINDKKYKIGVILGAAVWSDNKPSPLFSQRIKKGFEVYYNKNVENLQVTGGSAPGEITEANAAKNLLLDYGVNEENIFIEEETSTTSEQIKFIKDSLIISKKMNSVLVISDKFHLCRVMEISHFYKVNIVPLSSEFKLNWDKYMYYHIRESIGLLFFWLYAI